MNRLFTYLYGISVLSILIITVACQSVIQDKNTIEVDDRVEDLIAQMTLEEKAGQMTNISLMAVAEGDFWMRRDTVILDTQKMRELLIEKHVGSVQNLGTYPFSPAEWRKNIGTIQDVAINQTRLGIPLIYGIDAVHGANYTAGSTLFPQQLALAATWNPELAETTGKITSYEIKASGIPWNYSPVLDVCKQPLWGRIFETFGEDTYLTTVMGDAMIKGAQGDDISAFDKSAVCLKHFLGYGQPFNGKDRSPTLLPPRLLKQYHLPPFESAIKNGALTVMINSGSVNGIPSHADKRLITDVLKGELNFQGFTISDWEDVINLVKTHEVAHDEKEAVMLAVNAGLDMCMEPYDASFADYLVELVNEGKVKMSRVDDAVRRILNIKFKLGLFDQPLTDAQLYPKFGSQEFAEESYKAAVECLTLLKNDSDLLPLDQQKTVLVTGAGAHSLNALNGAWSRTWSGQETEFNDEGKWTILDAIRQKIGANRTTYVEGTSYDTAININAAVAAARRSDQVVVVLAEKPATEKPSDIEDLDMPDAQLELVRKLAQTGKPIVLVLLESRPRIIREIEPLVESIIMGYLPGNEGGRAIADIIYGDQNPSGKLPITYPRYTGSIWSYDHTKADTRDGLFGFEAFNPQFEFGDGMSYTEFSYDEFSINQDTFDRDDEITLSIRVSNVGDRSGKEVVQLFSRDLVASITPAVKQLRRFQKIELEPGQSERVQFDLTFDELSFINQNLEPVVETGEFQFQIDTFSQIVYLKI